MPSVPYRSSSRAVAAPAGRAVAAGVAILPLLALTAATLDAAIVSAATGLLKTIGIGP